MKTVVTTSVVWLKATEVATTKTLRQIYGEVNLIADREIQHIVRADGHRAHRTGFERIAFTGMTVDLILQFKRAR